MADGPRGQFQAVPIPIRHDGQQIELPAGLPLIGCLLAGEHTQLDTGLGAQRDRQPFGIIPHPAFHGGKGAGYQENSHAERAWSWLTGNTRQGR